MRECYACILVCATGNVLLQPYCMHGVLKNVTTSILQAIATFFQAFDNNIWARPLWLHLVTFFRVAFAIAQQNQSASTKFLRGCMHALASGIMYVNIYNIYSELLIIHVQI